MRYLLCIVVFAVVVLATACEQSEMPQEKPRVEMPQEKGKDEIAWEKRIREQKRAICELATRYSAVTDWEDSLRVKQEKSYGVCTVDVKESLIPQDGRPILFVGVIGDITFQRGQYSLYAFSSIYSSELETVANLNFALRCGDEQARTMLNQRKKSHCHAIVALVRDVQRVKFRVGTYQIDEPDIQFTEIEVESMPRIFMATGECIDFLYVSEEFLDEALWDLEHVLEE